MGGPEAARLTATAGVRARGLIGHAGNLADADTVGHAARVGFGLRGRPVRGLDHASADDAGDPEGAV